MSDERRIQRSDTLSEALTYQLEAVRRDYGVAHLALGSDDGAVMAFSGDDETTELLAALAPQIGPAWLTTSEPTEEDGMIAVVDLEVGGARVYLAGISDADPATHRGLEHARRGIKRIFKEVEAP